MLSEAPSENCGLLTSARIYFVPVTRVEKVTVVTLKAFISEIAQ
jgi:hypothetical protein